MAIDQMIIMFLVKMVTTWISSSIPHLKKNTPTQKHIAFQYPLLSQTYFQRICFYRWLLSGQVT